jgi:DNA-binding PadR family transcriptional regulator
MEPPQQQPSLGAWAVLALLREGDTHGWALVRALAPEGEIGRVWSIRRALVYRTVELLIDAGLAERAGTEQGTRGSPRTRLRLTPAGRRAVERWLGEPVGHVRDLRSALLLKLLLARRAGLDRAPLLAAQRVILAATVAALESQVAADDPAEVTVRAFRLETARAGVRFVDGELGRLAETV